MKQIRLYYGEMFLGWFFHLCAPQMSNGTLNLWSDFLKSYQQDAFGENHR